MWLLTASDVCVRRCKCWRGQTRERETHKCHDALAKKNRRKKEQKKNTRTEYARRLPIETIAQRVHSVRMAFRLWSKKKRHLLFAFVFIRFSASLTRIPLMAFVPFDTMQTTSNSLSVQHGVNAVTLVNYVNEKKEEKEEEKKRREKQSFNSN